MDMQPTGTGLMGAVAQLLCFGENRRPGHMVQLIVQRHGMGYDFKAFIERAIMLAVDVLLLAVGNVHNFGCVGIVFAGVVYLQFNTKVPISVPVENRFRLVAIVENYPVPVVVAVAGICIFVYIYKYYFGDTA